MKAQIRAFVETCGKHPFATGLFALVGLVGFFFSIFAFVVDQQQARSTDNAAVTTQIELQATRRSVQKTEQNIVKIVQRQDDAEAANFVPLAGGVSDDWNSTSGPSALFFSGDYKGKNQGWILQNDPTHFGDPEELYTSIESVAAKDYVQIAPYAVVQVYAVTPMSRNTVVMIDDVGLGGSAVYRCFQAYLLPVVGLQFAPLVNAETRKFERNVDYLKLAPGENEELTIDLVVVPDYIYTIRYGLHYRYKGKHRVFWLSGKMNIGIPQFKLPIKRASDPKKIFRLAYYNKYANDDDPRERMTIAQIRAFAEKNLRHVQNNRVFSPDQIDLPKADLSAEVINTSELH